MRRVGRPTIGSLESEVRDLINDTVHGYERYALPVWLRICAAMDCIGDTSLILDRPELRRLTGGYAAQYLRLYGLLQAVHAQQDAIEYLWETVVERWRRPDRASAWQELRIWRNILVAHSAKSAGAIARISMRGQTPLVSRLDAESQRPVMVRLPLRALLASYVGEARLSLAGLAEVIRSRTWEIARDEA